MEQILIDHIDCRADRIPVGGNASLLLIQTPAGGILGCGYLNCDTAEKLGHALAIVTGVRCFDDMLAATVKQVSSAAQARGVAVGMTGREALKLLA